MRRTQNPDLFTDALQTMLAVVDVTNRQHNAIARAYAEENLNKEQVLERFEADLIRLVQGKEANMSRPPKKADDDES